MSYARKDLADIAAAPDDIELAHRALARESGAFRTIMKTHNQRLYRLARGLVRDNGEAEDIVQEVLCPRFYPSRWLSRRFDIGDLAFPYRRQ